MRKRCRRPFSRCLIVVELPRNGTSLGKPTEREPLRWIYVSSQMHVYRPSKSRNPVQSPNCYHCISGEGEARGISPLDIGSIRPLCIPMARTRDIRAGDILWIPPGEKHWHGATATTGMTHIAIACSGVTRVTASRIAQPPKAAFVARLRPGQLPDRAARDLGTYRQLSGWNPPPLMIRAFGAHRHFSTHAVQQLLRHTVGAVGVILGALVFLWAVDPEFPDSCNQ